MKLKYSPASEKDLERLPRDIAQRVKDKMDWFLACEDPLEFAETLTGMAKTYRFRIGDYRVIFRVDQGTVVILLVLAIKHRSVAYQLPL